jgi:hydrogenase maturation protein HypF
MSVSGRALRVRGLVQGVGFRPTVWRLARELGLSGTVLNDGDGVLIRVWGDADRIDALGRQLHEQCPPLARIDSIEARPLSPESVVPDEFVIAASDDSAVRTGIVADAATCAACRAEIFDPNDRRYRYPFTNCTHCGPRLSIVRRIPYDRAHTSMAAFPMCAECAAEYGDPADRRFHAQPNACPVCGPQVWLQDGEGRRIDPKERGAIDAVELAARLLAEGRIVALKGIGGFHLACDAANGSAVAQLRRRKRRYHKPFALMLAELADVRRYVELSAADRECLCSPAAPIVLAERRLDAPPLAEQVAPGQSSLGVMLPYSPLHHLLLSDWQRLGGHDDGGSAGTGPLVMTSGNLSDEPQCVDNDEAVQRLAEVADYLLLHDRAIVNRVDDSVLRSFAGTPRLLRRARGYAPAPLPLAAGFTSAPPVLTLGGELKSTLCLLRDGQAVLSQHLGDLEDARTADAFAQTLELYLALFEHRPERIAVDLHPDYRSTRLGREMAERGDVRLLSVQHHHAHIASVLAENGVPPDGGAVLGIALDGLGYGTDGSLWGGEFLRVDYRDFMRLGWLKTVPMPGGTQAILQPWRNAYAQIATHLGWTAFAEQWPDLEWTRWLSRQPLAVFEAMLAKGLNVPPTSSCGRLFDAMAAVLDVCRTQVSYEGQAAIELEALALRAGGAALSDSRGYDFGREREGKGWVLDPAPMWHAVFADLASATPPTVIAARFHLGLARAVAEMAVELAAANDLERVALSGGVFQNRLLFEAVHARLTRSGLTVFSHRLVPSNDGGL